MNYFDTLNRKIKDYFKILSPIFPEWLLDYINTYEMQRISTISMSCGTDYSKCFDVKYWYSNLEHSCFYCFFGRSLFYCYKKSSLFRDEIYLNV